jgi:hypothetical protein
MTVKALNTKFRLWKGEIKNGYKHGFGPEIHPSKITFQEEYENGKLITGTTDDNNIQYTYTEVRQNQL